MIRLATISDFPFILALCEEFYKESPYSSVPYSSEKTIETILSYLEGDTKERVILLLVDSLDHPRGILAGGISSLPFSNTKVAFESVWFVEEEYRGKEALTLLDVFEYWGEKNGAKIVIMNLLNTELKDRLTKLYKRKGYFECETTFSKFLGI